MRADSISVDKGAVIRCQIFIILSSWFQSTEDDKISRKPPLSPLNPSLPNEIASHIKRHRKIL